MTRRSSRLAAAIVITGAAFAFAGPATAAGPPVGGTKHVPNIINLEPKTLTLAPRIVDLTPRIVNVRQSSNR